DRNPLFWLRAASVAARSGLHGSVSRGGRAGSGGRVEVCPRGVGRFLRSCGGGGGLARPGGLGPRGAAGGGGGGGGRGGGGGAVVCVVDLDGSAARALASEVGGRAAAVDVTDLGALGAAIREAATELGRLDIVHLNAGVVGVQRGVSDLDVGRYRLTVGV